MGHASSAGFISAGGERRTGDIINIIQGLYFPGWEPDISVVLYEFVVEENDDTTAFFFSFFSFFFPLSLNCGNCQRDGLNVFYFK